MSPRKPIRRLADQGWQVLDNEPYGWITCGSQKDAELIAEYESLCLSVFNGQAGGEEVADRLDAMAEALVRNVGRGTSERFCRHAVARARARGEWSEP
jgi:hypothetical protein